MVPEYAITFVRLTFLATISTVLGNTLVTAQLATGKLKRYQIIITLWGLWVFPLTWGAFKLGGSPVWAYIAYVFIYFVMVFIRIYLVKDLIKMSWKRYVNDVVIRCLVVSAAAVIAPGITYISMSDGILRLILVCIVSLISSAAVIYTIGMSQIERVFIKQLVGNRLMRR